LLSWQADGKERGVAGVVLDYDARRMKRTEIAVEGLRSIAWMGDDLVDWIGGRLVRSDGEVVRFGTGHTYRFDGSAALGDAAAVFETLGTKGRLMRWNGQVAQRNFVPLGFDEIREIDRSYYHAEVYDYPLCFLTLPDGRTAVVHCPKRYDTLEVELLDGTPLTKRDLKAEDIFHSRLAVSRDGRWLLDNGWVWHPLSIVAVYDLARALREPEHLSSSGIALDLGDAFDGEVDAATFSGDRLVVCSSENPMLSIVDLPSGTHLLGLQLSESLGTRLMAWDDSHVVALDDHPRLVSLTDGRIVHRWDDLGPEPRACPSVNLERPEAPHVAINAQGPRFAIADDHRVVIISA
jgi:hypothetical protein